MPRTPKHFYNKPLWASWYSGARHEVCNGNKRETFSTSSFFQNNQILCWQDLVVTMSFMHPYERCFEDHVQLLALQLVNPTSHKVTGQQHVGQTVRWSFNNSVAILRLALLKWHLMSGYMWTVSFQIISPNSPVLHPTDKSAEKSPGRILSSGRVLRRWHSISCCRLTTCSYAPGEKQGKRTEKNTVNKEKWIKYIKHKTGLSIGIWT